MKAKAAIWSLAHLAGVMLLVGASAVVIKIEFPSLAIDQIGLVATIFIGAYTLDVQRRQNDQAAQAAREKAIESRIESVSVAIDKLTQRFETHAQTFAHEGIASEWLELQKRALENSAAIGYMQAIMNTDDRLDEMKAQIDQITALVGGRRQSDRAGSEGDRRA